MGFHRWFNILGGVAWGAVRMFESHSIAEAAIVCVVVFLACEGMDSIIDEVRYGQ